MKQKYYLAAVQTLLTASKTLAGSDYAEIGALSDIKATLTILRQSMHETILDDLHRYLYIKNIPTADLLFTYIQNHRRSVNHKIRRESLSSLPSPVNFISATTLQTPDQHHRQHGTWTDIKLSPDTTDSHHQRQASHQLIRDTHAVIEDLESDPEAYPFTFIDVMLLSLDSLNYLTNAIAAIKQRIPLELFKIVDQCISEVQARWTQNKSTDHRVLVERKGLGRLSLVRDASSTRMLEDLIKTLYTKLFGVVELHRYAIESFNRISKVTTSTEYIYLKRPLR
jgi:exocyst complex component 4